MILIPHAIIIALLIILFILASTLDQTCGEAKLFSGILKIIIGFFAVLVGLSALLTLIKEVLK
jgi:hypothetical protein